MDVQVNIMAMHFDPLYWTDPYTFSPERFLDQKNKQPKNSFAYSPFGAYVAMKINSSVVVDGCALAVTFL